MYVGLNVCSLATDEEIAIGVLQTARPKIQNSTRILDNWIHHNVREDRINDCLSSVSILVECFIRRFVRVKYDDKIECYGLFAQTYLKPSPLSYSASPILSTEYKQTLLHLQEDSKTAVENVEKCGDRMNYSRSDLEVIPPSRKKSKQEQENNGVGVFGINYYVNSSFK